MTFHSAAHVRGEWDLFLVLHGAEPPPIWQLYSMKLAQSEVWAAAGMIYGASWALRGYG